MNLHRITKVPIFTILLIITTLFAAPIQPVYGHEYSASFTNLELTKTSTIMTFAIDEVSVIELAKTDIDGDKSEGLDMKEIEKYQSEIERIFKKHIQLFFNNEEQPGTIQEEMRLAKKGSVMQLVLEIIYPPVTGPQSISVKDSLYVNADHSANYVNLITTAYGPQSSSAAIAGKDRTWSMLLTETDYTNLNTERTIYHEEEIIEETPISTHSNTSGWFSFLKLGAHHILFGFDHLLFLLALLIVRQSFKQLALVITSFTVAHSITLTLTVLGWIQVPSLFVEAVIALSICYVALENVFRKTVTKRWVITFFFGLIHGMGFADILLEMNLPKKDLAINLASFNIGIELIQLLILVILLPIFIWLHRSKHSRKVMIGVSIFSFLLGAAWLVERLFF